MPAPNVSTQLIVFGSRNQDDIAGVLKEVAAAGFPAIEAGDMFESYGEDTTRRLLAENNLAVSGAHFGLGDYTDMEKFEKHLAYAKAMGLKFMMCSAYLKTVEEYKKTLPLFNAVGKRLADEGIAFNYHNHAWEFDALDGGVNGMELLVQETDPAFVKFNLDVFWLWYGHQDPAAFIRAHADRTGYFHFKDGRRSTNADGKPQPEFLELGQGEVDLKAAYAAVQEVGAVWVTAEQDNTKRTPLESLTMSRRYLRDSLGL